MSDQVRIRRMVEERGVAADSVERCLALIAERELYVHEMAHFKPMSKAWDICSRKIVELECQLAPFGLV